MSLHVFPPFPPMTLEGHSWEGDIELPAWSAFLEEAVRVRLIVPVFDEAPPSPEQVEACRFLLGQDKSLADAVLHGLLASKSWRGDSEYDKDPASYAELIGQLRPCSVYFHQESRDGIAYLGFDCDCEWDFGHGLGLLLHRERLVEHGDAGVAYFAWIARDDSLAAG